MHAAAGSSPLNKPFWPNKQLL